MATDLALIWEHLNLLLLSGTPVTQGDWGFAKWFRSFGFSMFSSWISYFWFRWHSCYV
jgi:hypothetical protein